MHIGKVEIPTGVIKNRITEQAIIQLFENHFFVLERIATPTSYICFVICKHFVDCDDTIKKIPEYKIKFHKGENDLAPQIVGIVDEEGEYVYDIRH